MTCESSLLSHLSPSLSLFPYFCLSISFSLSTFSRLCFVFHSLSVLSAIFHNNRTFDCVITAMYSSFISIQIKLMSLRNLPLLRHVRALLRARKRYSLHSIALNVLINTQIRACNRTDSHTHMYKCMQTYMYIYSGMSRQLYIAG